MASRFSASNGTLKKNLTGRIGTHSGDARAHDEIGHIERLLTVTSPTAGYDGNAGKLP